MFCMSMGLEVDFENTCCCACPCHEEWDEILWCGSRLDDEEDYKEYLEERTSLIF